MRQYPKAPAWAPRKTDARAFRALAETVRSERLDGVKIYYPRDLAAFDAVQYVLCTDATLGVICSRSGAIAAYRDGEFVGWQPTVGVAVNVCRSAFRR